MVSVPPAVVAVPPAVVVRAAASGRSLAAAAAGGHEAQDADHEQRYRQDGDQACCALLLQIIPVFLAFDFASSLLSLSGRLIQASSGRRATWC